MSSEGIDIMKIFDEEEQAIIGAITRGEGYSRNLGNIFEKENNLQDVCIIIFSKEKMASIEFLLHNSTPTDEKNDEMREMADTLTEKLIKYVMLFKYLEKEELAIFYDSAMNNENIITIGNSVYEPNPGCFQIYDKNVIDLLIKYFHKEVLPSPMLRKLEKNKFVSDEERRYRKQLYTTWFAIALSFFSGLCFNWWNNNSQRKQYEALLIENKKIVETVEQSEKSRIDYRLQLEEISEKLNSNIEKQSD